MDDLTAEGLLAEYELFLSGKNLATRLVYLRVLRHLIKWIATQPGNGDSFQLLQLNRATLETYLARLAKQGYSPSHQARVKAVVSGFSRWLIEEKELLRRNPVRGLAVAPQPLLVPRELSDEQRFVLQNLVERSADLRSEALFALGYWAGCRVSDVSWLLAQEVHLTSKTGWLRIGYKSGKIREIDLVNQAHRALYEFDQTQPTEPGRLYFFSSQRASRLSEAGIHHWFRKLKASANQTQGALIQNLTFHDLRHDWAHRARHAGWTLEEIAYYLGHITKRGLPAIATTARYTQVSRESLKVKLGLLSK